MGTVKDAEDGATRQEAKRKSKEVIYGCGERRCLCKAKRGRR